MNNATTDELTERLNEHPALKAKRRINLRFGREYKRRCDKSR